jgi:hypothetical protein
LEKLLLAFKHTLVGIFEAGAFAIMIGATMMLQSPLGMYLVLVGLFIGVVGLAIHDVWRV